MNHKFATLFILFGLILQLGTTACSPKPAAAIEQAENDFRPFLVEEVQVEIGVGSPIPVNIIVSGSWPDLCAQLSKVDQTVDMNRITVDILTSPSDDKCPPDHVGIPFRIALPLNMVKMAPDTYTVDVNGVETSFEWPQGEPETPEVSEGASHIIAYVGDDGNLWVGSLHGMDNRQITTDATNLNGGIASDLEVFYFFPKISSDGRYVAVRRDEGRTIVGGVENKYNLMVYNLETGESVEVFDQIPAGFDWKPGSHLLAYGQPFSESYFTARGEIDPSQAKPFMVFDMDTMTSNELVQPEGSYAIYSPRWSQDGRYLAFEEVWNYEGSGYFAFYDFKNMTYHTWGEPIGLYDWSADSNQITYDLMTYTPTGEERIYLRDLSGSDEQVISVNLLDGYAFAPAYSPLGDKIAYFVNKSGVDSQVYELYIQDLAGGDLLVLGEFISVQPLEWSSDGNYLFFSSGPGESPHISAVSVIDGAISLVAQGSFPTVATTSE